jgi:hypothetical protein
MPATNLITTRVRALARSFLLRAALIFSLASVACFSASSLAKEALPPLSKANRLACGEAEIVVQTACSVSSDGAPPLCTQKLTFKKSDAREGHAINYAPKPAKNRDEPFVTQVSCHSIGKDFYVIAHSSNFGNCSTCEWMDVYTPHGWLMGSTPSVTRSLQLPRKKLSRNLARLLDSSQESKSISIDRIISTKRTGS